MASLRGWAPKGQRLIAKVPHGRWKTLTFLAALRHDRIDVLWLLEGPINSERFRIYVEKVLIPTLKPGDIVIADNLGSYKGKAVRKAIRAAGARTGDDICAAIGHILDTYTPQECQNYFVNAGYE